MLFLVVEARKAILYLKSRQEIQWSPRTLLLLASVPSQRSHGRRIFTSYLPVCLKCFSVEVNNRKGSWVPFRASAAKRRRDSPTYLVKVSSWKFSLDLSMIDLAWSLHCHPRLLKYSTVSTFLASVGGKEEISSVNIRYFAVITGSEIVWQYRRKSRVRPRSSENFQMQPVLQLMPPKF